MYCMFIATIYVIGLWHTCKKVIHTIIVPINRDYGYLTLSL